MNKKIVIGRGGLLLALAMALHSSQIDFPKLSGPFLGQKPPGMIPEAFAPGIVSKEGHQAKLFFTPDGSEAIYDERDPVSNKNHFVWMRSIRGAWSKPVVIPFSTEYINNEPCLSPDGKKLFFVSNRPAVPGGEAERTPDIWMSERTEGGWGEPLRLGPPVNTPEVEVQPYFSSDGKLYFMRQGGGGRQLLCASFQDGKFLEPISLGGNIPPDQVSGPCISPDNQVLILHSRIEGGFGNWDLYASFKDASGNWGKLVNLGKTVNTEGSEGNATFSQDGKILFFTRDGDIFWVSSKIIEELRLSAGASVSASGEAPERQSPKLDDRLSILKPFIGPTWVGSIPDDSRMGEITLKWEVLLNGFAVRLSRHVLKFDHWLETTYFWDESSQKIAYLALSNNGVVIKGSIAGQGAELISEGDQRGPEVNRKARRIYRLEKDGTLSEDDQFRNSDAEGWRHTHVSVFVAK